MTPAFARSALNKGIQMNKVKRYACTAINGGGVKIIDSQNGHLVMHEDYEALQQQLTATTNSLTNAQEALKSAGIEADTVQAGVMELALMRDKMAAVARDFASTIAWADDVGALSMTELKRYDLDGQCEEAISRAKLDIIDAAYDFLNGVRAEGADMLAESLIENGVCTSSHTVGYFKQFAIQLRAGNAGKDGSHE